MDAKWLNAVLRAPAEESGAGGGAGEGGSGGADGGAGAGQDGGASGDGAEGGAAAKWHEDARFAPYRDWITAKGLTIDDPMEALDRVVRTAHGAEKHLGKPVESLLSRPAKDQPLAEWMRGQKDLFGLPEAADKYEITKPEMPRGVEWDEAFEGKAREIAFAHGLVPAAVNDLVAAYAERVGSFFGDAEAQVAAANAEMMTALEREWGKETPARLAAARSAAEAIGGKAGLDADAMQSLALALKPKVGDAGIMRMFAAIGEMMGEDSLAGGNAGGGLGTTPAEARAQLRAMDAADGEYGRAFGRGDRTAMAALKPKRDALLRLASGG